jgi:hypothetical protein
MAVLAGLTGGIMVVKGRFTGRLSLVGKI